MPLRLKWVSLGCMMPFLGCAQERKAGESIPSFGFAMKPSNRGMSIETLETLDINSVRILALLGCFFLK